MGKKSKNKRKNQQDQQSKSSSVTNHESKSPKAKTPTPVDEIDQLSVAAAEHMTEADLQAMESEPDPAPDASVEDLITKGKETLGLLIVQHERARREEEQAKEKSEALDEARVALEAEREIIQKNAAEINEKTAALTERQQQLEEFEQELLKRQEELVLRELDADSGFAQRNKKALESLEQEAAWLREEFSNHRSKIAREREAWEKELLDHRTALRTELQSSREEFDRKLEEDRALFHAEIERERASVEDRQKELQNEEVRLRKYARSIEVDKALLAEDLEAFDDKVRQLAAAKIEQQNAEIAAMQERLTIARQKRDELEQQIVAKEEADRKFGDQTPEEVLHQLKQLTTERDELRKALGSRPSAESAQRLEDLERQRERWEVERLDLIGKVAEMKQDLLHKRIAVTELEALRNHKAALEASNELLTKTLQDEIRKVNDLVRGTDGVSPFPSCSRMDNDNELQSTCLTTDEIPNLKDFTDCVRHRMACDPKTGKTLYYSLEDVRSFIAGLAMSRLHLLQGISGTGKTSLPLAFARAIGAGHALIEVQAGWRDRQDLIGHFNTFERRFYESEFLQALYKSMCPHFRDTPFIVVLDEMNLSHPEQYFADLLSALEQEEHLQRLVLMTAAVEPAPSLLVDGGRVMQLPRNVWFVGTANHDETTKDFADKTYDRAHVLELPRQRNQFDVKQFQPTQPTGLHALKRAFEKAQEQHSNAADHAYRFMEEHIGEVLDKRFRVGWGNRLQKQMELYVPVVIGCGGSISEATDHIIATKLLRKIRDRHDNRPEDIIALRDQVTTEWSHLDSSGKPKKSLAILERELHRLGHDGE